MRKHFIFMGLCLCTLAMLTLVSCDGEKGGKDTPSNEVEHQVSLDVTDQGAFTYFSFATGNVVAIDEAKAKEDLTWDLAFRWHYPRTNGGVSGKGQGAVLKSSSTKLSEVTSLPKGDWVMDTIEQIPKVNDSGKFIMPPTRGFDKVGVNKLLLSWHPKTSKMGERPTYAYDNSVFVMRTADGKYAKVQLLTLKKEEKKEYLIMKYVYPFVPTK